MKIQKHRCKCLHCKEYFLPDYRNRSRQRYCSKPDCKWLSKQQSQQAWLEKPENQNYFRGAEHGARVRAWQKEHAGYWKNTARWQRRTLQEVCSKQDSAPEALTQSPPTRTLQDLCSAQAPLFVGLISMWSGSTLQEDIAETMRRLLAKGHDILGMVPGMDCERFHEKTCSQSGATPESSAPVQLDRSPAGAGKLLHPV